MDDETILVRKIQIRRGLKAPLEAKLKGNDKPLSGELVFELPSADHPGGRLKVGDGDRDYKDLPYVPDSIELSTLLERAQVAASTAEVARGDTLVAASDAETAMKRAEKAADLANSIPDATMAQVNEYMDKKLHFLSISEYNTLEELDPDSFYFITAED